MDNSWLPAGWKAFPELVAQFNALQRTAILLTSSSKSPSWYSRHSSYRPTEGRGVQELDALQAKERQGARDRLYASFHKVWKPQIISSWKNRAAVLKQMVSRFAEPRGEIITIKVRMYDQFNTNIRGGDAERFRLTFTTPASRVPETFFQENGFLVESDEFDAFARLLFNLSQEQNTAASRILEIIQNLTSRLHRVVLRQEGDPRPWYNQAVRVEDTRFGGTHSPLLSHVLLPSRVKKTLVGCEFFPVDVNEELVKYFEDAKLADDCMDRALMENWKASWDKWNSKHPNSSQYPEPLTYHLIRSRTDASELGGRKDLHQLEKFLEKTNLSCVILDVWGNNIWKHVHEGPRPHVSPDTLYLVATNTHLYRVPSSEIKSASHSINNEVSTKGTPRKPNLSYSIPPDADETDFEGVVFCETYDELTDAVLDTLKLPEPKKDKDSHKKAEKPRVTIHFAGNLEDLFLWLRSVKKIQPELTFYEGAIQSLRLNLSNCYVSIRQFRVEGEALQGVFDEVKENKAEVVKNFIETFGIARRRLIHRHLKSRYSQGLRNAFETYRRSPLMRNFVEGHHTGIGIDIRSAYPSVLKSIESIPIFSTYDDNPPPHPV